MFPDPRTKLTLVALFLDFCIIATGAIATGVEEENSAEKRKEKTQIFDSTNKGVY